MGEKKQRPKAVIVGGSIAGVSCALALASAGWQVAVLEKSRTPPKGNPTGAGIGLDPQVTQIIKSWLPNPQLLHRSTLPLTIDQNQTKDGDKVESSRILTRDEDFNFRTAYWPDLHGLLLNALSPEIFLWGHLYISSSTSEDKTSVKVKAKVLQTEEIVEINADLLVGADGTFSSIRRTFLPDLKLRYAGYCAWRGVLDFLGNENSETILGVRRAYPELGKCIYYQLNAGTHIVLSELINKKLNWVWYFNQPDPELKGDLVTMKVSNEMIEKMHQEAEKVWAPELVRVMKETKEPFINIVYDCDPLDQICWDNNVVLVGDAAHPTTPHGVRSTNMSVLDAAVLGKCVEKWGAENIAAALEEYQRTRVPVISKQVLHARRLGRIKQGLAVPDRKPFDPRTAGPEECEELQEKYLPFFANAPVSVD